MESLQENDQTFFFHASQNSVNAGTKDALLPRNPPNTQRSPPISQSNNKSDSPTHLQKTNLHRTPHPPHPKQNGKGPPTKKNQPPNNQTKNQIAHPNTHHRQTTTPTQPHPKTNNNPHHNTPKHTHTTTTTQNPPNTNTTTPNHTNTNEPTTNPTNKTPPHNTTKNPRNPKHIPGGSSDDPAAVIAARLAPASLGSNTSGPIRQPASHCGITGIKPTSGTV
ncbi:amidase family protein, partial [Neisseria sp. P0018.S003]|uniref:amidase family protein n=1 Tax=Neisseria sp. P0018.S003 TaxID=3436789 RepID=UPI003F81DEEA